MEEAQSDNPMMQQRLWAPWRLAYIKTAGETETDGCFLCRYSDSDADAENLVVDRSPKSIAVLNRFPYNNGHLLVAPLRHKATLDDLEDEELFDCAQELKRMTQALKAALQPHGFNIGLNLGRAAGAGLPGHLHWHIVPRWDGDTNFMSVMADVKVIPQSLEALFSLLQDALRQDD